MIARQRDDGLDTVPLLYRRTQSDQGKKHRGDVLNDEMPNVKMLDEGKAHLSVQARSQRTSGSHYVRKLRVNKDIPTNHSAHHTNRQYWPSNHSRLDAAIGTLGWCRQMNNTTANKGHERSRGLGCVF